MELNAETLENLKNLSPEEQQKIAENLPTYKQLQSSSSKWVEKMNKAIEFYKSNQGNVAKLKEFNESNPEVAKVVLEKFYDGKTIEELQPQQKEINIEEQVALGIEKQRVADTLEGIIEQLPSEQQELFRTEYAELTKGQNVTSTNVKKFVKATMWAINPDIDDWLTQRAKINSLGGWGGNKTSTWDDNNSFYKKQADAGMDILKAWGLF